MAEEAEKAGHKSKSKNFLTIVSLAFLSNEEIFKRVSQVQCTSK